jgi:hypothetical protein
MDPISNVDRLVLLLRQRLDERARAERGEADEVGRRQSEPALTGPDALRALASVEGVDDRQLKRALIQNLLAEALGPGLINDAGFQQVVEQVTETLDAEPASAQLLARVAQDLRAAAR